MCVCGKFYVRSIPLPLASLQSYSVVRVTTAVPIICFVLAVSSRNYCIVQPQANAAWKFCLFFIFLVVDLRFIIHIPPYRTAFFPFRDLHIDVICIWTGIFIFRFFRHSHEWASFPLVLLVLKNKNNLTSQSKGLEVITWTTRMLHVIGVVFRPTWVPTYYAYVGTLLASLICTRMEGNFQ